MLTINTGMTKFKPGGVDGNVNYCQHCRWLSREHLPGGYCPPEGHVSVAELQKANQEGWLVPFSFGILWAGGMFMAAAAAVIAGAIMLERNGKNS